MPERRLNKSDKKLNKGKILSDKKRQNGLTKLKKKEGKISKGEEIQKQKKILTFFIQSWKVQHLRLQVHTVAWVANEKVKIDSKNSTKEERQQALADLLQQHTKLLQMIDRLKITASHNNKKEKIQQQLKEMSSSKVLQVGQESVKIQTQYTIRAKELKKLYQQLALEFLTLDERVETLEAVKETVQVHQLKSATDA